MINFPTLLVGGIPLLVVIFGLVEFIKSLGLNGKWLTVVSLLLGAAFGIAYQIATGGPPAGYAEWFVTVFFGLALVLITSGFYDFANKRFPKTE